MRNDQIFVLLLVILLPMSGCFDSAVGDVEGNDNNSETSEKEILELENQIANLESMLEQSNSSISSFESQVSSFESQVSSLESQVSSLESQLTDQQTLVIKWQIIAEENRANLSGRNIIIDGNNNGSMTSIDLSGADLSYSTMMFEY